VQAEEILKAAKLDTPTRTDVRLKLLEIYAKRRDTEAFNADAQDLHMLTDGAGADWSRARELAKDIGSPSPLFNASHFESAPASAVVTAQEEPHLQPSSGLIDFDLSTFSLDLHDAPTPTPLPDHAEDPKLALAEEYLSIGDHAGARSLIEEVIHQNAHPQIVTQAHQMLARLG
jgi:pilus assembly protein FimV